MGHRYIGYGAAVVAASLATLSAGASAQQPELRFHGGRTGELATLCSATAQSAEGAASVAYCEGFFVAAGQYHQEQSAENGALRPIFCLPTPSPTFDEARASFVAWVRANPQYKDERSVDGLLRFAATAYPCAAEPTSARRRR